MSRGCAAADLGSSVPPPCPKTRDRRRRTRTRLAKKSRSRAARPHPRRPLIPPWRWAPLAVATAVPALLFFVLPPLTRSGLWDPYELNVADLSRRIALNLYHAGNLALDGADNSLPHLNDLGRPQLPFSSIALGFKLFGLHEWAGRLPLALWGLLGVLATYAFVARLFDRRTGTYAAVDPRDDAPLLRPGALDPGRRVHDVGPGDGLRRARGRRLRPTTPEGARVARWAHRPARARAVAGHGGGRSLRRLREPRRPARAGRPAARGRPRVGRGARRPRRRDSSDPVGDAVGAAAVVAGAVVVVVAVRAVAGEGKDLDMWIGTLGHPPPKYPTFDFYVAAIGHAMAPWSAFLPFAFGRLLLTPARPVSSSGALAEDERQRESLARTAVLVGRVGRVRGARVPGRAHRSRRVHRAGPLRRGVRRRHPRLRARRARLDRGGAGHARRRRGPAPRLPRAAREGVPGVRDPERPVPRGLQGHGARALVGRARRLRPLRAPHVGRARRGPRAVRPLELRQGAARAARGLRRHPGARVLRDDRRGLDRRAPGRRRDEDARALAAADVVHHPRPGAQRVVAHLVHPAGARLRVPLRLRRLALGVRQVQARQRELADARLRAVRGAPREALPVGRRAGAAAVRVVGRRSS